jgi:hypothetical protein
VSAVRKMFSLLLMTAALVAWLGYLAAPTWGQQSAPAKSPQPSERHERKRGGHGGPPRDAEAGPGLPLGRFPGARLFHPLPEDQGPLTPAEQRQLMSFVRECYPDAHRWLKEIQQRDPEAFQQRLQEAAPRLRHLHRIFERDPELGQNIVRYSENLQQLHHARRAWRDGELAPEQRRRIRDGVRRVVAENLRIEVAVLEDQALELEQQRDARIEAEFERLLSPELDLAEEPPEVREVIERLAAPQEDDDLESLEDQLREICSERLDREVTRLRNRAARWRENAVEEVDRRMMWFSGRGRRGPQDPAPHPGKESERGQEDEPGHDKPNRGRPPGPRP